MLYVNACYVYKCKARKVGWCSGVGDNNNKVVGVVVVYVLVEIGWLVGMVVLVLVLWIE